MVVILFDRDIVCYKDALVTRFDARMTLYKKQTSLLFHASLHYESCIDIFILIDAIPCIERVHCFIAFLYNRLYTLNVLPIQVIDRISSIIFFELRTMRHISNLMTYYSDEEVEQPARPRPGRPSRRKATVVSRRTGPWGLLKTQIAASRDILSKEHRLRIQRQEKRIEKLMARIMENKNRVDELDSLTDAIREQNRQFAKRLKRVQSMV